MEFTRDTESPDQYHFWTAATIIGAASKRQVHLPMGHFRIYPNIYCIIVGPSGARKSAAVSLGSNIALQSGLKRFSDKITAAALIKDLSEASEKRIDEITKDIELCSPVLIYSSELGVFMGPDAYGSGVIADLTDLYDNPSKWEKKTIARDAETVVAPYVSLLAASTPQTLRDVIPPGAVGQGFTSRIIFVWGGGRRKRVPNPEWSVGQGMLEKELIHDLKEVSKVRGLFQFTRGSLDIYQKHYMGRPEPEDEFEDERLRGYSSRKDIHTLKLAMVLSLADKDELIITEQDMAGAIESIKWLDTGLPSVFSSHGASATVEDVTRIFRQIEVATKRVGYATHSELVRRNYTAIGYQDFGVVIETLKEAGAIEEILTPNAITRKLEKHYRVIDPDFIGRMKTHLPNRIMPKEED